MNDDVIDLAIDLISRRSVTPEDAGCQELLIQHLTNNDFSIEEFHFEDVKNFWAKRQGKDLSAPVFLFAGHTDVVPSGPENQWRTPPFQPIIEDGILYGRGAADMKGSIAAMIVATNQFIAEHPNHRGSIAYLITSDEEGPFINGTVRVVEALMKRNEQLDYCLVGEPSSSEKVGDVVKNGRRGSLSARLTVNGHQGHVAYPDVAINAIHQSLAALHSLVETQWDAGNEDFPASSFQITSFQAGSADNIIPGIAEVKFNFRYSTEQTAEGIKQKVRELLDQYIINNPSNNSIDEQIINDLSYELKWKLNGEPFLTKAGKLVDATLESIEDVCGYSSELSTAGGTSDGRFIAKMGIEVIELGPINKTIHKINEAVAVSELQQLVKIYQRLLEKLIL
jgi:succinyl-diaminopimelate desuccinylase